MKFIRFKLHNFILLVLLVVLASFGSGYIVSRPTLDLTNIFNQTNGVSEKEVDLNLFWEVLGEIKEKYIGRDKIDYQEAVEGAVTGMVNSLQDPYTVFLDPDQLREFKEGIEGVFEGIGAEIGIKNNVITVISPLEDSPAQKAGLRAGDKILKIDETVTIDMTVEQAVEKIRGEKDSTVSLLISREGWTEAKQIQIVRQVINVPSVRWAMKDDTIAHVQIFRFGPETTKDFTNIAKEISKSKAQKIVLDLRNNPGGFLETSVEVASLFLPENKLVVVEDYGNGKKDEYKTSGKPLLENYPLIVLVNQGSASAAEILAGALKDQKNVKLIGETTFGKGSVQELEYLRNGGAIKITVAKWFTPAGKQINDQGLKPDIEIKQPEEIIITDRDLQLEKALETIKAQ